MSISIKQLLSNAKQQLISHSDTPLLDAELLLAIVLQQPRSYLHTWPEKTLTPEQSQQYAAYLARRGSGEPLAYITGKKEFWSFELTVTPDTLIPRADTELLVESVLKSIPMENEIRLADLGTGSGAIAIAIAHERPNWIVHATDKSTKALQVAKENAKSMSIANIQFHAGSWLSALPENKFDVIVSNPPYISEQEWQSYHQTLRFEPAPALVSANDGLADIEEIISSATSYLKPNGYLFLEHGFGQGAGVRMLLASYGYNNIETVRDLASHERVTLGRSGVV